MAADLQQAAAADTTDNEDLAPETFYTNNRKTILHQTTHQNVSHGWLGVEYIVEIYNSSRSVRYLCRLCNQFEDAMCIQMHIVGFRHRLNYLKEHFPTVLDHIRVYMCSATRYGAAVILHNVCKRIDQNYGHLRPYSLNEKFVDRLAAKLGTLDQIEHQNEADYADVNTIVPHEPILALIADRPLSAVRIRWASLVLLVERPPNYQPVVPSGRRNGMPLPFIVIRSCSNTLFHLVLVKRVRALRLQHAQYARAPESHPHHDSERDRFIRLHRRSSEWSAKWTERLQREYTEALVSLARVAAGDVLDALHEHAGVGRDGVRVTFNGMVFADDMEDVEKVAPMCVVHHRTVAGCRRAAQTEPQAPAAKRSRLDPKPAQNLDRTDARKTKIHSANSF